MLEEYVTQLARIGNLVLGRASVDVVDSSGKQGLATKEEPTVDPEEVIHFYRRGVHREPNCPRAYNWCGKFSGKQSNDWSRVDCDACFALKVKCGRMKMDCKHGVELLERVQP